VGEGLEGKFPDEVLERIERIEGELERIDLAIADLEGERELVLLEDEQYNGYVEMYCEFYNDEPLGIREYYELVLEFDGLTEKFEAAEIGSELEAVWEQYHDRLAYLERVLAA